MTCAAITAAGACGLPQPAIDLTRDDWTAHPRFPQQTLLLGSHHNFRRISDRLVTGAEQLERSSAGDDSTSADLTASRWLFESWMSAMAGHERYEEHKLYRFLAHRFGGSFSCLEEQHHQLHLARDDVRAAYKDANGGELLSALRAHRDILNAHLDQEEAIVIPLLLELSPAEFERYYDTPIRQLLSSA